jgi:hypothetical protein
MADHKKMNGLLEDAVRGRDNVVICDVREFPRSSPTMKNRRKKRPLQRMKRHSRIKLKPSWRFPKR